MYHYPLPDNTIVELELHFIALDKPKDVKKLKSLELTGAFINEAVEIDLAVIHKCVERVGRFPAKKEGGPTWYGVIMDTNSCDDDHWWYEYSVTSRPENWKFYDQPGALIKILREDPLFNKVSGVSPQNNKDVKYIPNPDAENVDNHQPGYDYWLRMVPGQTEEHADIFICNEYGSLRDGKPVYPQYKDRIHTAEEDLKPIENISISLGWDFGLTPACVISQIAPNGQKRILDELFVPEHGAMGIRQFAEGVVRPHLEKYYADWLIFSKGIFQSFGDPAGGHRAQTDEITCLMILSDPYGVNLPTSPARTNSFIARKDAVTKLLTTFIDGEPALLISPRCKSLRKGFRGAYYYERVQVSGTERYKDQPCKNHYSHIHDALQYDCLMSSPLTYEETEPKTSAQKDWDNIYGSYDDDYESYDFYGESTI